jgi:hypothetical protein
MADPDLLCHLLKIVGSLASAVHKWLILIDWLRRRWLRRRRK